MEVRYCGFHGRPFYDECCIVLRYRSGLELPSSLYHQLLMLVSTRSLALHPEVYSFRMVMEIPGPSCIR